MYLRAKDRRRKQLTLSKYGLHYFKKSLCDFRPTVDKFTQKLNKSRSQFLSSFTK